MFYLFQQNNSYGRFVVDDKLCHRLFIEAENEDEAIEIAEDLGCYWDGVKNNLDCPCCGDRWSKYCEVIDIEKYRTEGCAASVYDGIYTNTIDEWHKRYDDFEIIEKPHFEKSKYSSTREYVGIILFNSIGEYAQYLANEYMHTKPDARIFYKDGEVKEIFSDLEEITNDYMPTLW